MWVIKGISLGLAMFVVGFIAFNVVTAPPMRPGTAIGLSYVYASTVGNPFFWLGLLGCLLVGVSVVGSWPIRVPS